MLTPPLAGEASDFFRFFALRAQNDSETCFPLVFHGWQASPRGQDKLSKHLREFWGHLWDKPPPLRMFHQIDLIRLWKDKIKQTPHY